MFKLGNVIPSPFFDIRHVNMFEFELIQGLLSLNQRMDIKLSEIQEKINQSQSPLPLFTCLHVKPDVSELMFAGNSYLFFSLLKLISHLFLHV